MTYTFRFQDWLVIRVYVRKATFSKHPAVSSEAEYKGSVLYKEKENVYEGLLYEKYSKYNAILMALCTLGRVFSNFKFVYDEYPDHIEHDWRNERILPYNYSRFPIGSTFRVIKLLVDSDLTFYYVLENSEEGTVLGDARILRQFPEITDKYSSPVTWDDSAHGYLSKKLIGKRFRVLKFGSTGYGERKLEELPAY